MHVRIKITAAPPSNVAPEDVRKAWIGLEMPATVASVDDVGWDSGPNAGGYIVQGVDALNALLDGDRVPAAHYWSNPMLPKAFRFGKEFCEVVSE